LVPRTLYRRARSLPGEAQPARRGTRRWPLCLLAAILLGLAVAPNAGAVTMTYRGAARPGPYQQWADSANVPTVPFEVRLSFSPHLCMPERFGKINGCALWDPLSVVLARRGRNRNTLWHELGHIFDFVVMGAGQVEGNNIENPETIGQMTEPRRLFSRYVDRHGPWASGRDPIREEFAEAYRACARNPDRVVGVYGHRYAPDEVRHRAICNLIRRQYNIRFPNTDPPDTDPPSTDQTPPPPQR
jgi:hypothetical protein